MSPRDGIGRHNGLKIRGHRACRFESGRGYHKHSLCAAMQHGGWALNKKGIRMPRKAKVAEEPRETRTETIEQYLARGGKVTVCPPGQRSEDVAYKTGPKSKGRKKKKAD